MTDQPRETLARMLLRLSHLERAQDEDPFILASGKSSRRYFECSRTTAYAPAMPLIGELFYRCLLPGIAAVGGPTRGADPIADSVAYYSALNGNPINTFSVLKNRKDHGVEGWIEGSAKPQGRVALLDDVITSGASVIDALRKCRQAGLQVEQVIALLDREEGGIQRIREYVGPLVPVEAVFRLSRLMALKAQE